MKRIFQIAICMLISLSAWTQNQRAIEITNVQTADYQAVTGTKIMLIPPHGFRPSTTYIGFGNALAESSIMVTELHTAIFRAMANFDRQQLFKAGMVVEQEVFYKINGYDALLISGKQALDNEVYAKMLLFVGDLNITYMICSTVPAHNDAKLHETMKNALLSVIYQPNKKINIYDKFDFTVDLSGSGLKEASFMLQSLMLTDDGKIPSETSEKTSFMIKKTPLGKTLTATEQKQLAVQLYKLYPFGITDSTTLTPRRYNVGQYVGYEIMASGKSGPAQGEELVYQVVLFVGTDCYIFSGLTYGDKAKFIPRFRKVVNSFKLKKPRG